MGQPSLLARLPWGPGVKDLSLPPANGSSRAAQGGSSVEQRNALCRTAAFQRRVSGRPGDRSGAASNAPLLFGCADQPVLCVPGIASLTS